MWQLFLPKNVRHSVAGTEKDKSRSKRGKRVASTSQDYSRPSLEAADFVKIRHILCEKHSKILEALEKIQSGAKFEVISQQYSEDNAQNGGDFGWNRRQDLEGAFADAAFRLKVGEMTQTPVQTKSGYHLILCEGRKASP